MSLDVALLRKAVEFAEHEQEKRTKIRRGSDYFMRKGEHTWYQRLWAQIRLNKRTLDEGETLYSPVHLGNVLAVNPMTCGSTGCVAGHICVLAGDRYVVPVGSSESYHQVQWVVTPEGKVKDISRRAEELLGVPDSYGLFAGSNSIHTVRRIAWEMARDHGEEL